MSFSKNPALYITAENLFSVVRLHLSLKKITDNSANVVSLELPISRSL